MVRPRVSFIYLYLSGATLHYHGTSHVFTNGWLMIRVNKNINVVPRCVHYLLLLLNDYVICHVNIYCYVSGIWHFFHILESRIIYHSRLNIHTVLKNMTWLWLSWGSVICRFTLPESNVTAVSSCLVNQHGISIVVKNTCCSFLDFSGHSEFQTFIIFTHVLAL